jgi:hypothetical protein
MPLVSKYITVATSFRRGISLQRVVQFIHYLTLDYIFRFKKLSFVTLMALRCYKCAVIQRV